MESKEKMEDLGTTRQGLRLGAAITLTVGLANGLLDTCFSTARVGEMPAQISDESGKVLAKGTAKYKIDTGDGISEHKDTAVLGLTSLGLMAFSFAYPRKNTNETQS